MSDAPMFPTEWFDNPIPVPEGIDMDDMLVELERAKAELRHRLRLPSDAPLTVLGPFGRTFYVYPEGTFVHFDGGTLDLDAVRGKRRIRRSLRRMWGWVRYAGWR